MSEPSIATAAQKPVFTANAGVQAGYKTYGCDGVLALGPKAGVKIEHNGFHAGADIGIGTALTANVEAGKEFDINKNWGLDLSANAGTAVSMLDKNHSGITHHYTIEGQEPVNQSVNEFWRAGITTAGVKAMGNYTTDNGKFKFGAGLSGQYVTNHAKNISLTTSARTADNTVTTQSTVINSHQAGVVVSPELTAEFKANKNLSFRAEGNLLGGGVTACWTF